MMPSHLPSSAEINLLLIEANAHYYCQGVSRRPAIDIHFVEDKAESLQLIGCTTVLDLLLGSILLYVMIKVESPRLGADRLPR